VLSKNYRSHKVLLKVSNEAFYQGLLQDYGDKAILDSLLDWPELTNRSNFPLQFIGVNGIENNQIGTPNFINSAEAVKVAEVVSSILSHCAKKRIHRPEIGVITLFRNQVVLIRQYLRTRGFGFVRVGTVDNYQGQEERVIIISTVLTQKRWISNENHPLVNFVRDFVQNAKRFNVAITRAKSLMVVIGCPSFLMLSMGWKDLLSYCLENGAYSGVPFERENRNTAQVVDEKQSVITIDKLLN